jgi:hypothetical protein
MAVAATLAVLKGGTFARNAVQRPVDGTSIHDFLSRHWKRPLAPQGSRPARFSTLETSLAPESCGTCHPAPAGRLENVAPREGDATRRHRNS